MKYKCYNIDYAVEYEDAFSALSSEHPDKDDFTDEEIDAWIKKTKKSLPKIVTLDVDTEDCESVFEKEDMIVDALSDETNWLINSYEYEEVK